MSDQASGPAERSDQAPRGFSTRAMLLRVSVGLEDLEDLQADFAAALAAIPASARPTRESVPALGAI